MERRERRDQGSSDEGSRDPEGNARERRDDEADAREAAADRREQESDVREGVLDRWERELAERAGALGLLDDDEAAALEEARQHRADDRRRRRMQAEGRRDAAVARGIERGGRRSSSAPEASHDVEAVADGSLAQLADLTALVERGAGLVRSLGAILALAIEAIDGAAAVTMCLVVSGRLEPAGSTAAWAAELDSAQLRGETGPIPAAVDEGAVVGSRDLAGDDRWDLGRAVTADGDRGVLAVPIAAAGEVAGVLTVYAERGVPLDRRSALAAVLVAGQVSLAVGWNLERLAHQAQAAAWERAVASRDEIGQAKGILMRERGLSADEAFDLLRTTSQRHNTKVRAIAQHVVAHGGLPEQPV